MKCFLQGVAKFFRQQKIRFECYFLGETRDASVGNAQATPHGAHELIVTTTDLDEPAIAKSQEIVFIISRDPYDAQAYRRMSDRVLLSVPKYLEETISMIDQVTRTITEPLVIVAVNFSGMIMKREGPLKNHDRRYEECFSRVWFAIRDLQIRRGFRLVIVDHEATLGKKNSDLLRRLWNS